MYESFFGLNRRPFPITPDARCFAKIGAAANAFDSLLRCLEYGEGVGIMTGATGSGKSLLCLSIKDALKHQFETAYLAGENFRSYAQFLKTILSELDEPAECNEIFELQNRLKKYAGKSLKRRQGIVLFIDEAQSLQQEIYEGLRVISNWNAKGNPLVRLLLSGNWDFEEMLASPELEFLNQRVGAHVILESFSKQETSEYIDSRIRACGGKIFEVFTNVALDAIGQISEGVPKTINLLCDRCLSIAFENNEKPVSLETVKSAVEIMKHLPVQLNDFSMQRSAPESEIVDTIESAPIVTEPIAIEMEWNDSDESESFSFEVGASDVTDARPKPIEATASEASNHDSAGDESFTFEVGSSVESSPNREWQARDKILVDSSNEEPTSSTELDINDEARIGLVPLEMAEISGDIQVVEGSSPVTDTESPTESIASDETAEAHSELDVASTWEKIPVDLHWSDSAATTSSSLETETSQRQETERCLDVEPDVEFTSSQKYARIRPEQLLQTLVSEAIAEPREKIESDSSWLRHNDTKIFDCVASEPVSYCDHTYHKMKDDYNHSLELVAEVSAVASTFYENDVIDSLLTLLKGIEEKFSVKGDTCAESVFASSEIESATYALLESHARFDESSDANYDVVLPETSIEEQDDALHSRHENHGVNEIEVPQLQGIGESRYLVSDLYRRESL